ncbi:MAG: TolC family protein [Candidatus Hydrogenedentota bacterium]
MCIFMSRNLCLSIRVFAFCLIFSQVSVAQSSISEREAVERALRQHPALIALRASVNASEAAVLQAGLRPNPELSFEMEELRFSDGPDSDTVTTDGGGLVTGRSVSGVDNDGFDGSEITVSVSQRFELGQKRSKRIALANQATRVALWDYEIARADIIADTRHAFIEVLAGQERMALQQELIEMAGAASKTVHERIDSGKISPLEGNRADILLAQARISLAKAERELNAARATLAAQWGGASTDAGRAIGDLSKVVSLPDRSSLEKSLLETPELARWSAEVIRREEAVHLERALGKPDVTVSAGWRSTGLADSSSTSFDGNGILSGRDRSSFEDNRENSFVLGFSIPLQIFNRNQGSVREAEHRVSEASYRRRAKQANLLGRVTSQHEKMNGILSEVRTLETDVVPIAFKAYEATKTGFELGKFPYLSVLDAQRTLFIVRNQHMEAMAEYQLGVVDLERLLGSHLDDFSAEDVTEAVE